MPTYKTPDIYIEEISVFPPSVAEVETAVPAFIGYTQRAERPSDGESLLDKPTKVFSLKEYEALFGGPYAPSITVDVEDVDGGGYKATVGEITVEYILYHAMKMFFDNGGGQCYVVSVGGYDETIEGDKLIDGLKALELEDEPTLLVVPEAVRLSAEEYGPLVQEMLAQCDKLQDRFAIFDVFDGDKDPDTASNNRPHFGMNYLKYGAAYYPFVKTSFNHPLKEGGVNVSVGGYGPRFLVSSESVPLTSNPTEKIVLTLEDGTITTVICATLPAIHKSAGFSPPVGGETLVLSWDGGVQKTVTFEVGDTTIQAVVLRINTSTGAQIAMVDSGSKLMLHSVKYGKEASITIHSGTALQTLGITAGTYKGTGSVNDRSNITAAEAVALFEATGKLGAFVENNKLHVYIKNTPNSAMLTVTDGTLFGFSGSSVPTRRPLAALATINTGVYNFVKATLKNHFLVMPPSAAVAGVYAATDARRGVWKAPANVGLADVLGPVVALDKERQAALNVDPTSGKSINAIRAFSGKGTLVWGARTLAGNDNEWRHIPVRRFYNMVEESLKKSTYWAVFEPNDANTWTKVRGMIENYLTSKWRDGALVGATPKDAFFVRCGLGTTMTAQDVLEGKMFVEIGMAVVRPAEFIILRFSHLLQSA